MPAPLRRPLPALLRSLSRHPLRHLLRRMALLCGTRCTVCGKACPAYEPYDNMADGMESSMTDGMTGNMTDSMEGGTAGYSEDTTPCGKGSLPANATLPPLCPDCAHALRPRSGGYCSRCGLLFAQESLPVTPCSACLAAPPPWHTLTFCGAYEGTLRHSILRFKFHGALELGPVFGSLLAGRVAARFGSAHGRIHAEHTGYAGYAGHAGHAKHEGHGRHSTNNGCCANGTEASAAVQPTPAHCPPQVIIPVPLHPARLAERGYNQTLELARLMVKALNIPLQPNLLLRPVATPHQIGLSRQERQRNLRNAFAAPHPERLAGMHILLVDDIMTTGSTIAAATQVLLQAGAGSVHVAVVARTPEERPA
ncbi:ComF family protein [Desulfovibrio psychrotolerans]|uniref:Amidophosphoribosyltransferase n=1 Tax=Desulfovibrio psychrotolerans TaxID=415242 RepID=A0A7J0BTY5_9BACT|nr:ComF family protein [Desulfovibrio psychrotolerans]GFM37128.1 amidophosphoribosyltransferase [Desulfovibrio psychrotolerans]